MAPLLYETFSNIMRSFMNRFVKSEALSVAKNLHAIDVFDKNNRQDAKKIYLGFATREAISKIR